MIAFIIIAIVVFLGIWILKEAFNSFLDVK